MPQSRTFDLIVIGGGVSGISSVLHLLKSGFTGSIGLLEGRERLGGRIHSSKTAFEEMKIEIGANWIHGIIGNPIFDILYKRKLVDPVKSDQNKSVSYNIQAKTLDGKDVNSYWIHKVYDAYSNMMKRSCLFFTTKDQDFPSVSDDSLGAFLRREADKWIEAEVKDESVVEVIRGLFDSLFSRETCISGCNSMDEVSLQYIGAYEEFSGGNLTIPYGYYSLIEALLEDINSMCDAQRTFETLTARKVTKIVWPGIDQNTADKPPQKTVEITCANADTFECAHVIVTLPLGVMKHEAQSLFSPALPVYKLECIQRMGFGTVDKIFLEYSSKSIISNIFTRDGVTTDEMMLIWDQADKAQWYSKIYSIYRISDHCIQLWISGEQAQVLEDMFEDQINTELTEQLRRFFGDTKFPRADSVLITRWGSDEFCRGSYSFISNGSSREDVKRFAMPIYRNAHDPKPVIAFAGEATHESYFSTVHGAFLSGQIVAKHFAVPSSTAN